MSKRSHQPHRHDRDPQAEATDAKQQPSVTEHDADDLEDLDVDEDTEDIQGGTDRHGPMRT